MSPSSSPPTFHTGGGIPSHPPAPRNVVAGLCPTRARSCLFPACSKSPLQLINYSRAQRDAGPWREPAQLGDPRSAMGRALCPGCTPQHPSTLEPGGWLWVPHSAPKPRMCLGQHPEPEPVGCPPATPQHPDNPNLAGSDIVTPCHPSTLYASGLASGPLQHLVPDCTTPIPRTEPG